MTDSSDFDRFCDEHEITDGEYAAAFAAWLHERTGWDGPVSNYRGPDVEDLYGPFQPIERPDFFDRADPWVIPASIVAVAVTAAYIVYHLIRFALNN